MQELSQKIELHYLRTRPEEELQIKKEKLYQYIQQCVHTLQDNESDINNKYRILKHISASKIDSSSWTVFKFGSESDGTSLPTSDIDIGVYINFKNKRKDKEKLLYKLSKNISENDKKESLLVKLILHARYPIIKVFDIYSHCTVNISIADRFCYQRNELIKQYINYYNNIYSETLQCDECIKKLIVFIKYWSKIRDINNAYYGYLNSFGFVLFVLKFIKWFTKYKLYQKEWNVGEIVKEFYTFYVVKFDETIHSISITEQFYDYDNYIDCDYYAQYDTNNNSDEIFEDKYDKQCVLEVIDPVNVQHNVTKNVGYDEFEHIKYEFIRAIEIFDHNKNDLFNKFCKSTKESEVKYDVNGHVHYGLFMYSKEHNTDTRYKYDNDVHWILKKI